MTIKEFDQLKVGDRISNKRKFGEYYGGYDYKVIKKSENQIEVIEECMDLPYILNRDEIEKCIDLHKIYEE